MERYFSSTFFAGQVLILYFSILNQLHFSNHSAIENHYVNTFPFDEYKAYQKHLTQKYATSFDLLINDFGNLFDFRNSSFPDVGFSGFFRLNQEKPDLKSLINFAYYLNQEHQINIYPSYLFGGDLETWKRLYPNSIHLRVKYIARL